MNVTISIYGKMEPAPGIKPGTDGLQNRCSIAELSWLKERLEPYIHPHHDDMC